MADLMAEATTHHSPRLLDTVLMGGAITSPWWYVYLADISQIASAVAMVAGAVYAVARALFYIRSELRRMR